MKMLKRLTSLLASLAIALSMVMFSSPLVHAEENQRIIHVGLIDLQGYASENADGTFTGANVEFTYKIAQYANLNIQIKLFKSGKEALDELDQGTIDIMCNVLKTQDREEKYLFTDREIGSLPMSIFAREDDSRFSYNNTSQINEMIIGAESGTKVKDYFNDWCQNHGIAPVIKEYNSLLEIENAINAKEIDAGIYGALSVDGYRTLGTFASQPYYFALQKKDYVLKNQIDDAMGTILSEDPLYRNKLINKYVSHIEYEMEALTKEEKAYILAKPEVKVAVLENDAPYYSREDNKDIGVVPDLYQKIAVLTGLHFTYQVCSSEEEALEAVKNGTADVLGMYSDGQISAYNKGLRVTTPYADVDAVLVTHSGVSANNIKKIAVKKRTITAIQTGIGADLNADFVGYNSGPECFEALKEGAVDGMICGQPSANWLINQSNVSSYSITTIASGALEISGALAYDNSMLCSILSKAVNSTSYSFNELVTNNTLPSDDLMAAVTRVSPSVLLTISCVLIAMVISLIWALTLLIRHQKEKNVLMQMKAENERREIELAAAEKQTEDKNRFFSNISHDMRTPLNAIIGFSDIASQNAVSPATIEYLAKIKTSGQLLNDLINDTLTISKVNSGKMMLQEKPTDTNDIFDAVYCTIQEMASKKNISFTLDRSECRERTIMVDSLNLEKILLNLLTNAVKYTNEGGWVRFTAKIVNDEDMGIPETVMTIEDNGIGISEEFLPRIYEPFLQEDNTGNEASGTGLGLSIVKNLIDIMGGTIEVESRKNEGTKFTLHFHFAPVDHAAVLTKTPSAPVKLAGRKILLCEDNALNREIAVELLKSRGIVTDQAVNGRQGVEMYLHSEANEYDAVLMDVRMPVMNGLEAAQAIRSCAREDASSIPIIAITANAFDDDIKECMNAGMNAHIAKPIEPEVMFRIIAENIVGKHYKNA